MLYNCEPKYMVLNSNDIMSMIFKYFDLGEKLKYFESIFPDKQYDIEVGKKIFKFFSLYYFTEDELKLIFSSCDKFALYGCICLIKHARTQIKPQIPFDTKTSNALLSAMEGGNLEVFQYLVIRGCYFDEATIIKVAEKGDLELLKWFAPWFLDNFSHVLYCFPIFKTKKNLFCRIIIPQAMKNGHIHIIKWILEEEVEFIDYLCSLVAEYGALDILKFLRSQNSPCPWRTNIVDHANMHSDKKILNWILENSDFKI